jgi:hypothetical protein
MFSLNKIIILKQCDEDQLILKHVNEYYNQTKSNFDNYIYSILTSFDLILDEV